MEAPSKTGSNGLVSADNDKNDAGRDRRPTSDRWNGDGLLVLRGGLKRSDIQHLFRFSVGDAFRGQGDYPKDNENDTDNR